MRFLKEQPSAEGQDGGEMWKNATTCPKHTYKTPDRYIALILYHTVRFPNLLIASGR